MGRIFIYGGEEWTLVQKCVLSGMENYYVFQDKNTGRRQLYLYCASL